MLGALVFGMRGAVITYLCVSLLYAPYVYLNWTGTFSFAVNKLSHAAFSGVIAVLAGFLVDREKRLRKQSEKDHYLTSLGQAAAAIVHDLKNPLITVSGFARRIREGKGDVKTSSETILDSAARMQMIVTDVLDFAKPVKLVLQDEDLSEIVRRACKSCAERAEEKEVDLTMSLPDDPVMTSLDSSKMERALVNLINNAIDASLIGYIVSIAPTLEKESIIIRIKDYGSGMDKETVENIFIPFYTKKSAGTGLGMAIAKKIIDGHQGHIDVKSREQTGTEVIIRLPL
jgi:signal transduction histidine kinase